LVRISQTVHINVVIDSNSSPSLLFNTNLVLWVEYEQELVAILEKDSRFAFLLEDIAQQGGFEHSSKFCQHQYCGQQFHQDHRNLIRNLHIFHGHIVLMQNVFASLPEKKKLSVKKWYLEK